MNHTARKENPLQIVDISLTSKDIPRKIFETASSQGFLFVEGHNLRQKEVDRMFSFSTDFFSLTNEEKTKFKSPEGYTKVGGQILDPKNQSQADLKETLNLRIFELEKTMLREDNWLQKNPSLIKEIITFINKLNGISQRILQLLAIGMDIEGENSKDWFSSRCDIAKSSPTGLHFLHYPAQNDIDDKTLHTGAHTDFGAITLLFQREGEEGLEILAQEKWQAVPFIPNNESKFPDCAPPLVVNIGDLLSYWSAGTLKSTKHRVKCQKSLMGSTPERYSIAYFCNANDKTLLEPIPSKLITNYKPLKNEDGIQTAGDLFKRKLSESFQKASMYKELHGFNYY